MSCANIARNNFIYLLFLQIICTNSINGGKATAMVGWKKHNERKNSIKYKRWREREEETQEMKRPKSEKVEYEYQRVTSICRRMQD